MKETLTSSLGVSEDELRECFLNRCTPFERTTISPDAGTTLAFSGKTDRGRILTLEFRIKDKIEHILQLPNKQVRMEENGVFCEIIRVIVETRLSAQNSMRANRG
jgi:hypothetical protein